MSEAAAAVESPSRIQPVLVKLLQGIIFQDDTKLWQQLLRHEDFVRRYFTALGLYLYLSTEEGYGFLRSQRPGADPDAAAADTCGLDDGPDGRSLVRRIPLSFDVSLLCVLLREALEMFDAGTHDDHRLIVRDHDLYEMLRIFYPETTDLAKQQRRFDQTIAKVEELQFLRRLQGQAAFEVTRVIKAFIDAEFVATFKRAAAAANHGGGDQRETLQ